MCLQIIQAWKLRIEHKSQDNPTQDNHKLIETKEGYSEPWKIL